MYTVECLLGSVCWGMDNGECIMESVHIHILESVYWIMYNG